MNGIIEKLTINGFECSLYLPQEYCQKGLRFPVVYLNDADNISEIITGIESHFGIDCKPFLLLSVQPRSWEDDYTPWPAPALTKKSETFGGNASEYINYLISVIKPFMDTNYKTQPEPLNTVLIGYSLGGLAALYALYTNGIFGKIGSVSGSLWYDGWTEFMDSNVPVNIESKVYLSLGKGEEHSRNQRMASVGNCTRKSAEILESQLILKENLALEWNDGGHFNDIPMRLQRALLWLMKADEKNQ